MEKEKQGKAKNMQRLLIRMSPTVGQGIRLMKAAMSHPKLHPFCL